MNLLTLKFVNGGKLGRWIQDHRRLATNESDVACAIIGDDGNDDPNAANDSDSPTDDDATGACVQRVIFMEYSIESGVFCITAKNLTVT